MLSGLAIGLGAGAIGAASAGVFCRAVFMPRSRICGPVIFRGSRDGPPRIALTFDDGPDPRSTPRILDALGELKAPAAFFVIGRKAQAAPAVLRRIHDEGHIVGNHSYEHATFGTLRRRRYWIEEIERTDRIIEQIIGRRPALFRPPMGFKTFHITRAAAASGHAVVTWTRRAFDGLLPTTQRQIVHRLQERAAAGDIILLHDGLPDNRAGHLEAIAGSVRPLVTEWRNRGVSLVRLDELIKMPAYQADDISVCDTPRGPSSREEHRDAG